VINRDVLARLIADFHENPYPKDLIDREFSISLEIPIRRAIALIGPRRSGKTYAMFQLIKTLINRGVDVHRILYVNFEYYELTGASLSDAFRLIEEYYSIYPENRGRRIWLFLDEVQELEDWDIFVRNMLDRENMYIYISGSSSKMLSRELSSRLRGRTLSYEIYPLSFREYLRFRGIEVEKPISSRTRSRIMNAIAMYMEYGGYPEVARYWRERIRILHEIMETTIVRDVVERYRFRNERIIRLMMKALANSREFSVHRFHRLLKSMGMKVSKNTLYSYLQALNDVMIVYPLRRYSPSYKREEQTIPKIYFIDNGLLRIYGVDSRSKLFENLVFTYLLRRRGFSNLRYYKSYGDREVDFVVLGDSGVDELIQACYNVEDPETRRREIKALLKASTELGCRNLYIVTWDYEDVEEHNGRRIMYIPLWKLMLKRVGAAV